MYYSQSEKMEVIRIVEESEIAVVRTLRELGIEHIRGAPNHPQTKERLNAIIGQ